MIDALFNAAQAARRASSIDGRRTVEILLSEEGFAVRGESGLDGFGVKWRASAAVGFEEFNALPHSLGNAVRLVDDRLKQSEGEA